MNHTARPALWLVYLQLGAGMATFGSATPMSKLVTDAFPVYMASGLRMGLAAAVLLPIALVRGLSLSSLTGRDWLVVSAIAVVGMFGFTVFLLYGMQMVSGVVGSIVMSLAPAVTAMLSFLFFKDRLGWRKAAGIALGVAGVMLLNLTGGLDDGGAAGSATALLGALLVFLAVCSEAGYTLFGKLATERLDAYAIAGLSAAIAFVLFLIPGAWQASTFDFGRPTLGDWIALLWWGAGTLVLGSVLWYQGIAKVDGATAAGFMGVMPVSALLLSYIVLGEPFRWVQIAGFTVVFLGVCLIAWSHARAAKESGNEDETAT